MSDTTKQDEDQMIDPVTGEIIDQKNFAKQLLAEGEGAGRVPGRARLTRMAARSSGRERGRHTICAGRVHQLRRLPHRGRPLGAFAELSVESVDSLA